MIKNSIIFYSAGQQFSCSICFKSFEEVHLLNEHVKVHAIQKQFNDAKVKTWLTFSKNYGQGHFQSRRNILEFQVVIETSLPNYICNLFFLFSASSIIAKFSDCQTGRKLW